MALIPPEKIEEILATVDITDVVGRYFPLRRAGPVFKALCPFHQERTPSFTVNPQRRIFKCFGCGAGGNAIGFVMKYENLDFVSAAKKVAEIAGLRVEQTELSAEDAQRFSQRRRLLSLHAEATEFFHAQLMRQPSAAPARAYLKARGIGADVAKSWQIGYAPESWDAFTHFAQNRGYEAADLLASGLVKLRDEDQPDGAFYDRFRGRVMFPIFQDDSVIGFSGRILEAESKAAKYVNSPETILFKKGAVLFGLHKSKRALIDAGSAIVCEGQIDLITAFESGVKNVIAPQGTAFTDRQARILKRLVQEVLLCFDADSAGEKAVERSLAALLAEDLLVRVVRMPPGEDPDSLIRRHGAEAFRERVAAARDFFDDQIERLAQQPDFSTPRGKIQATRKMAGFVSLLTDRVTREAVMHRVTQRLEISTTEFVRLLRAPAPKNSLSSEEEPSAAIPPIKLDPTLKLIALIALHDVAAREWLLDESWDRVLADDPDGGLLVKILAADLRPDNPASLAAFLGTLEPTEEAAVSGLLAEKIPHHPLPIAHDCWRELERRQLQRRLDAVQARLRATGLASAEVEGLQKEVLDLRKRLLDIARPLSPPL